MNNNIDWEELEEEQRREDAFGGYKSEEDLKDYDSCSHTTIDVENVDGDDVPF